MTIIILTGQINENDPVIVIFAALLHHSDPALLCCFYIMLLTFFVGIDLTVGIIIQDLLEKICYLLCYCCRQND